MEKILWDIDQQLIQNVSMCFSDLAAKTLHHIWCSPAANTGTRISLSEWTNTKLRNRHAFKTKQAYFVFRLFPYKIDLEIIWTQLKNIVRHTKMSHSGYVFWLCVFVFCWFVLSPYPTLICVFFSLVSSSLGIRIFSTFSRYLKFVFINANWFIRNASPFHWYLAPASVWYVIYL